MCIKNKHINMSASVQFKIVQVLIPQAWGAERVKAFFDANTAL
jgi:hypothetical protein